MAIALTFVTCVVVNIRASMPPALSKEKRCPVGCNLKGANRCAHVQMWCNPWRMRCLVCAESASRKHQCDWAGASLPRLKKHYEAVHFVHRYHGHDDLYVQVSFSWKTPSIDHAIPCIFHTGGASYALL